MRLHCDGGGYAHALPCIVHGAVGIFAPCLVDRLELAEGAQAEVVERHADASHSESEHFMDGQCFFSFFRTRLGVAVGVVAGGLWHAVDVTISQFNPVLSTQ